MANQQTVQGTPYADTMRAGQGGGALPASAQLPERQAPAPRTWASPAAAVGVLAVGALALGALAIGALAIGRLAIKRARIGRLEIDELVVRNL